jgi:hypothetical protein
MMPLRPLEDPIEMFYLLADPGLADYFYYYIFYYYFTFRAVLFGTLKF